MTISVIIPAFEHITQVMRCVNSLRETAGGDFHIHVQDDSRLT